MNGFRPEAAAPRGPQAGLTEATAPLTGAVRGSAWTERRAWPASAVRHGGLAALCAIALVLGGAGLANEGYAPAGGDVARYLMNGAYIHDAVADGAITSPSRLIEYTELYYARYPALSIGHHPMLLPVAEATLFAMFGVSVAVGRLVPLLSLVVCILCLHGLVNRRYGRRAAFAAGVLFVTSPVIVTFSRMVMAEIPSLALLLASIYFAQRFSESERRRLLAGSAIAFVACLYAKPLPLLVSLAIVVDTVVRTRRGRLLKVDVFAITAAAALAAAPAVLLPLMVSSSNSHGVLDATHLQARTGILHLSWTAVSRQLAWPVIVAAAIVALRSIVRRDTRCVLFLLWIVSVAPALFFFGGLENEGYRYTLYWVPAFCALAGALVTDWRNRWAVGLVCATVAVAVALHARAIGPTLDRHLAPMKGYEEAAEFVLRSDPGPTVLFSGDVDTGYFAFFVRKHDRARQVVVLRSDKIFATSLMAQTNYEERIQSPAEIYPTLHSLGTRYVVLEDVPSQSRALEWLRQEAKSSRFQERLRVPIGAATDARLSGASIAVFELLDRTPPDPDAVLSLHLPIVGRSVSVPLRDLLNRKLLR